VIVTAVAAILSWAVFIYGPEQREVGGREMADRLTQATNEAAEELSNAADKNRIKLRICRESGGVFSNFSGECER
jgi:hypothetical protein